MLGALWHADLLNKYTKDRFLLSWNLIFNNHAVFYTQALFMKIVKEPK